MNQRQSIPSSSAAKLGQRNEQKRSSVICKVGRQFLMTAEECSTSVYLSDGRGNFAMANGGDISQSRMVCIPRNWSESELSTIRFTKRTAIPSQCGVVGRVKC